MCLIVFAYRQHPGYRLVMAGNRDEFLDRPTAPLGYHFPGETIVAGRDLRGGGTWLALAGDGRLAAITNYRDPRRLLPSSPSRGEIIVDYLRSGLSAARYLGKLAVRAADYNGFNLLLGDGQTLFHFSNISAQATLLAPGLYGLSNQLLDTPWPKVVRVKALFRQALGAGPVIDREAIFTLLADAQRPEDELLPDTGVGRRQERLLSTIFIHSPEYGTRSSTLLTIADKGTAELCERSYRHQGEAEVAGERCFQLQLGGP
ncbi:MAG: NRDE family protein [Desulfopila sp.]